MITLPVDGNYRIVVKSNDGNVGNYGFSVIDTAQNYTQFNTTIAGKLAPGNQDKVFRFKGSQGQKLYFDSQIASDSMGWVLYDPSNSVISSNTFGGNDNGDMEVNLPSSGEYVLALRGYAGFANTPSYQLEIVTSNVTVNPLTLNQDTSGSITLKGNQDLYTFTGTAGEQLFYDDLGTGSNIQVLLTDPTGRVVYNNNANSDHATNEDGLRLLMNGTYTVTIDGNGPAIGNYKFRLLNRADSGVTAITTDNHSNPGVTDFAGTYDNQAKGSTGYRFSLPNSTYVYINGQQGDGGWTVYDASGQLVAYRGNYNYLEVSLNAGEYWLVEQGRGSQSAYKTEIITPSLNSTSLTLNQDTSGSLSLKGEQHYYTFTGTAGEQLFYDDLGTDTGLAYYPIQFILTDPTGRVVENTNANSAHGPNEDGLRLLMNGTYTVTIDGNGPAIGNYKFRLLNRADSGVTAITTDNHSNPGVTDFAGTYDNQAKGSTGYRFSLPNSTYVYINGQQGDGILTVYDASGQQVAYQDNSNDLEVSLNAGEYWLVEQGRGSQSAYKTEIITPSLNSTPLTLNQDTSGSLSLKGEQHYYTFTGTAGEQLFYDDLGTGSNIQFILTDPIGRVVENTNANSAHGPNEDGLRLLMNGTYTVTIDGNGPAIGNYKFRLLNRADSGVTAITTDNHSNPGVTDFAGTYDNQAKGSTGYRFSLPNSTYVYINGQQGDGILTVYDASGQQVAYQDNSNDLEVSLNAGEYWLVEQGRSSQSAYKTEIITPSLNSTPLTLNQDTSGSLSLKGEQHYYTFTGTAGEQLFYDDLGTGSNIQFILTDPIGRVVENTNANSAHGPNENGLQLLMNGTYTVTIDGNGPAIGNYKFRLLDNNSATLLAIGDTASGTFNNGGIGSVLYRFDVTGTQTIDFNGQIGSYPNSFYIYNSNGSLLAINNFNSQSDLILFQGEYLLAVQGNSTTAANQNYQIKLTSILNQPNTNPTPIPITLNTVVSGNAQKVYKFDAIAGQSLYFDSLSTTANVTYNLSAPNGHTIISNGDAKSDRGNINIGTTGTYQLIVTSNAGGDFKFELISYANGATNPTKINLGDTVSGSFGYNGTESKFYRFTATANEKLSINPTSGDSANDWIIYAPDGTTFYYGNLTQYKEVTLTQAGEYTLVMEGNGAVNNNFSLQLIGLPSNVIPLTIGTDVSGNLIQGQSAQTYSFIGTLGQELYFDSLGGDYFQVLIYDPSSKQIFNRDIRYDVGPDGGLVLQQNGVYTVIVQSANYYSSNTAPHPGTFNFRFLDKANSPIVNINSPLIDITGNYDNGGLGAIAYQLNLTSQKYLAFKEVDNTQWSLYSANGQQVITSNGGNDTVGTLNAGSYFLVMQGQGNGYTNYHLQIYTPTQYLARDITADIANHTNITDSLIGYDRDGKKTYTFNGKAGQELYFDSLGGDYLRVEIYDSSGKQILNTYSRYDVGPDGGLVLQQNGVYTVIVQSADYYYSSAAPHPGTFNFRFLDKANSPIVNINSPLIDITGNYDNGGLGAIAYQLNLTSQKYLAFKEVDNTQWSLYSANGQQVITSNGGNDTVGTLNAGSYFLVMQGQGNGYTNYHLQIYTPTQYLARDITADIANHTNITDSLIGYDRDGKKTYTFNGKAGQELYFDSLGGDYLRVEIYDSSGKQILNTYSRYDVGPDGGLVLQQNGVYTVIVQSADYYNNNAAPHPGTFNFRFLDRAVATPITFDTPISGTFDNNALGSVGYRFSLTESNYLYFNGQQGDGNWLIYGANGQLVNSSQLYNSKEFWLGKGDYFLVMQGIGSQTNYQLTIFAPDLPSQLYTLGTVVNSTLVKKGEIDTYTFNGIAGQHLFYDALATASVNNIYAARNANWKSALSKGCR